MKKLIKKRSLLVVAVAGSIALLLLAAVFLLKKSKPIPAPQQNLIGVPGIPENEWPRQLDIREKLGFKIITNVFDEYAITVPDNWEIPEKTSVGGALNLFNNRYYGDEPEPHEDKGLVLVIRSFKNNANFSLVDWIARSDEAKKYFSSSYTFNSTTVNKKSAYETSYSQQEDELLLNATEYVTGNKNNIYVISCFALGGKENPPPPTSSCEEHIQSFTILE